MRSCQLCRSVHQKIARLPFLNPPLLKGFAGPCDPGNPHARQRIEGLGSDSQDRMDQMGIVSEGREERVNRLWNWSRLPDWRIVLTCSVGRNCAISSDKRRWHLAGWPGRMVACRWPSGQDLSPGRRRSRRSAWRGQRRRGSRDRRRRCRRTGGGTSGERISFAGAGHARGIWLALFVGWSFGSSGVPSKCVVSPLPIRSAGDNFTLPVGSKAAAS